MQLIRYISKSLQPIPFNYNQLDPILFISDYNVGVQYAIHQTRGNCSIRGIRDQNDIADDLEYETNQASTLGFVMRMKSPEKFLNFDADYAYTGQRITNGLNTDKYIAVYNDLEAIFEYSISTISQSLVSLNIITEEVNPI
jgi:hypothetical protein